VNEILVGDCVEVMSTFPNEYVDLTVTSPPYDDLRSYNGFDFNFEAIADELYRVTKQGGVVVWVVGDSTIDGSESGSSFRQALYFKEVGFVLHDTMIYMKNGPSYPSKDKYYQIFEYMFVLSKGRPKTFNPIKDRKNRWHGQKWSKIRTRRDREGNLKVQEWYKDEGEQYGVRFNIWQYNVGHGYQGDKFCYEHPASFPEALAKDHILSWSNPGDLVLDPMCGSGTTLKMAKEAGRHWIGIDVSEDYVNLSHKRLEAAQPPLFV
jgi:site-specific DNA-methyltransferase (adenine-specific)